ncbi:allophanate hydrolase subunit 2-domain-containing protein [Aspergillus egyptiacus]|nr:allophanate hydrolase subunit 2-domain-containing protein [Aspergillus egyptiacus]
METIKTLLIANRGEIAVRISRTAKKLGIRTIAIYTEPDAASTHVHIADEAVLLSGSPSKAYIDGDQILEIAKKKGADAIIPGYGFLSENADFARAVSSAGLVFVGPSPESIEAFGLKHTARDLATKAGVPIVPGSQGLVTSEDEAVTVATSLGFPVMLKATAGGGGMGLLTCGTEKEVRESFQTVQSRGEALFKNAGLFIERYYPSSHHIEVQVFGNGQGKAIAIGERECSIQRRHQKVIEECPSPFVTKNPELRKGLCDAAVRLAESINYGSAGTIEYLVDDETGAFFFLEMNTRLQVEHGISELCYGVDLVELMLKQADAQLSGKGGLEAKFLSGIPVNLNGVALEARVYAENPVRDFAPCPGTLQSVEWKETPGTRIDTWVYRGIKVSAYYDPLLAKVMYHASDRQQAIEGLKGILTGSHICGPPTNLEFLAEILASEDFRLGNTLTRFLNTFEYSLSAIDVVSGGAYTLVQDWPGRPTVGKGFCHSGPMDSLAFRIANALVGNDVGVEGLEITLSGPELRFLGPAIISLCGAPIEAKLDDAPIPMWSRIKVSAGQRLKIGKTTANGCRSYLAVFGGFLNVAEWFFSKATAPMVGVGGYQGRQLTPGDYISITKEVPDVDGELCLPSNLIPQYPSNWELMSMPGPYDEGYLTPDSIDMLFEAEWTISHNAARGGIRLLGPKPTWARPDGGEGGAHPSNLIEYGYAIGSVNWTGDDPVIFPQDAPDLGGFVSSHTIAKGDFWKLGQLKAGDKLKFRATSLKDALTVRNDVERFINDIVHCCQQGRDFSTIVPLSTSPPPEMTAQTRGSAIVHQIPESGTQPLVSYRQAGDDYLLIDYGTGAFDLNHRYRVTALKKALSEGKGDITFSTGLTSMVGCGNSLMLYYDGTKIPQQSLINYLCTIEAQLGDLSRAKMPSRRFKLPLTFESKRQDEAIKRYMETQRPYAAYLPDNMDFVARNNAFTRQEFENIYLTASFMVISVGFFTALPLALPVDPRQRMNCPKMNPSRVFTPAGQVSWGGSCLALYTVDSPGGYQMTGMTIPGVDILGSKPGYTAQKPWLFEDFDQITFYRVSEEEYERQLALFQSGRYEYEWEEVEFDMAEHNRLLAGTKDEVKEIRARQRKAQAEMDALEKELLERWAKEKAEKGVPMDTIDALLKDPAICAIEAPLNANVWKVEIKEGDKLEEGQVAVILEAMKLEIAVRSESLVAGGVVEKILVQQGDSIEAGKPLVLVRKG